MSYLLGAHGLDGSRPLSPGEHMRVLVAGLNPQRVHFQAWRYWRGELHEGQSCATCPDCGGSGIIGDGYLCPTCDRQAQSVEQS